MSTAANMRYVESLITKIRKIPVRIASHVAEDLFHRITEQQINESFDSGQAALNWQIEPVYGSPSFDEQQMLWGTRQHAPSGGAGFKSGQGGSSGNAATISEILDNRGFTNTRITSPAVTGFIIYNPITPGYANFFPGDDDLYEQNALGHLETTLQAMAYEAMKDGYTATNLRFAYDA